MPALMELDLRITEKQDLFIHSEAFETLFGGAALSWWWKILCATFRCVDICFAI